MAVVYFSGLSRRSGLRFISARPVGRDGYGSREKFIQTAERSVVRFFVVVFAVEQEVAVVCCCLRISDLVRREIAHGLSRAPRDMNETRERAVEPTDMMNHNNR